MTLSQKTIEIVKSTAPVLETHGVNITSVFYKNMFTNHPELLNIFNHANQSQGRQQTALANMVYAAAKNIDQLEAILPAVQQVAFKHRGLGVKPEHYPIVGEHLLQAIKEVLGDAATDEVIEAWAEAYGVIAQAFIGIEEEMYDEAEKQAGGWKDFKPFKVIDKIPESEVITSFYLQPADGMSIPNYAPGQYITIRVQIPGEKYTLNRQYSLSVAPGREYFRISVKKEKDFEPNGKVSNYLHDHVSVGDQIEVSAPAGDFHLVEEEMAPIALISGGVGLTPMMSMLDTLVQSDTDRAVTFIHSARNEEVHAFAKDAENLVKQLKKGTYYYGYEKPTNPDGDHHFIGYITEEFLKDKIANNTVCYVCGPVPFLKNIVQMLANIGVSKENIRYEFFGPAMEITKETAAV
ncbi:NO-inducible flavohemoprotein [Lederbergia galactosidilytica]|uniref:Flavohemoprotein n=2 Tax=Lederbergia galactosidilytica TaxID=217031 RepID=A0A177ZQ79_9BACI|nr:NO-inducible flavohemoprotein [Lederbergia galactosidilytica]MBP1917083.1 nitric oxide dioxygenase [Lederbergia galactosidilytica]OAK70136.1 dihydropteridine reductase [Lederbergia galactosidilytica]